MYFSNRKSGDSLVLKLRPAAVTSNNAMEMPSWTPASDDQIPHPIAGDIFDFQPYGWAEAEMAPFYGRPPWLNNHSLSSGQQTNASNQHSDAGHGTFLDCDIDPLFAATDETRLEPSSNSNTESLMTYGFASPVATVAIQKKMDPGQPLTYAPPSRSFDSGENQNVYELFSSECLSKLSESMLEKLAENLREAFKAVGRKKDSEVSSSVARKPLPKRAISKSFRATNGQAQQEVPLECEYPGCTSKFGRKKDQSRHFRAKHEANEGFRCPLIDCVMGTGHKVQRRDKLRDHLFRKAGAASAWQCIIPGCLEIATCKTGLIDHLGGHDRKTRLAEQQLLIDYGFINGDIYPGSYYDKPPLGYLTCEFICQIRGCQFGTNSFQIMSRHLSIPHSGSHCTCPMPGCQEVFQDWGEVSSHLARNHDAAMRKTYDKELLDQGFWWRSSVFTCPICKQEIRVLLNKVSCDEKIREHCSAHDPQLLKNFSKELVHAFASSNRRILWYPRMPLLQPATDNEILAYLTWPKEDLLKIWNMAACENKTQHAGVAFDHLLQGVHY